jgi:uncharacterized membrane protein YpjA
LTDEIAAAGMHMDEGPRDPWTARVVEWLLRNKLAARLLRSELAAWLLAFIERRRVASLIVFFNSLGFLLGMVLWYGPHLFATRQQWYLWPFIPDCPLFAGLFVVAFWGILRGRRWPLFYLVTAYGLIKYGVWTDVYTIALWATSGRLGFMSAAMGLTHLGMILEGIYVSYRLLVPRFGQAQPGRPAFSTPIALAAFGWFLLSDIVDYGLGQYPRFDTTVVSLPLMQWHTVFMTMALGAAYVALSRRLPGPLPPPEADSIDGGSDGD